ncbi:MAG TPA: hypothetical protein VIQ78_05950 [Terrimesophilobacter sp.]|uniref:hypothetical protein n=1 Tax=Terrimesophilobacter sp. TaxID=2906435 RepID=UPI002F94DBF0
MNVHELDEIIAPLAGNGRGVRIPVRVVCDGREREVRTVDVRAIGDRTRRVRDVKVLIVADSAQFPKVLN